MSTTTLAAFADAFGISEVNLLKIDCEGCEFVDPSLEPSPGQSASFFSKLGHMVGETHSPAECGGVFPFDSKTVFAKRFAKRMSCAQTCKDLANGNFGDRRICEKSAGDR